MRGRRHILTPKVTAAMLTTHGSPLASCAVTMTNSIKLLGHQPVGVGSAASTAASSATDATAAAAALDDVDRLRPPEEGGAWRRLTTTRPLGTCSTLAPLQVLGGPLCHDAFWCAESSGRSAATATPAFCVVRRKEPAAVQPAGTAGVVSRRAVLVLDGGEDAAGSALNSERHAREAILGLAGQQPAPVW
mmetsp:Transcript_41012/g.102615  ORF Transcript_41012/g.102615 Transcript_41012/m.102615 type:complete len:190 (+) Transcript_41012:585-1154(+)